MVVRKLKKLFLNLSAVNPPEFPNTHSSVPEGEGEFRARLRRAGAWVRGDTDELPFRMRRDVQIESIKQLLAQVNENLEITDGNAADLQAQADSAQSQIDNTNGDLAAHEAAVDPHPQYLTEAEGDALFLSEAEADGIYFQIDNSLSEGDPTEIKINLGLGTTDNVIFNSVTTNAIELGHASDTTLSRASAGNLFVEGNLVYRAGGTDVPVADGGTGSSTAAGAATNLGLGTGDSPQFTAVNIGHASDTTVTRTGAGDIAVEGNQLYRAGGTDVPVADGGTGASNASGARTNLGLGTAAVVDTGTSSGQVPLMSDHLSEDSGGSDAGKPIKLNVDGKVDVSFMPITELSSTYLQRANNLSDVADSGSSRTNLGVGTSDSPQFTAVNVGHASDTTLARSSAGNLTVEGNLLYRAGGTDVPITDGGTGASDATTARDNLGVGPTQSVDFGAINLGGFSDSTLAYLAPGDLEIEGNRIYRASGADVAVTDGGTGASTAAGAATNLGLGTGDSPQFTAVNIGHASDTTITRTGAGDIAVEGNALYRAGGTDVPVADGGTGASTAANARTNLGVGTGDSPEFTAVNIGHASDTTLTRVSAGVAAIEGKNIYLAGGTDVAVADGGTGSSTAAGAATNLGLGTGDSPQFTAVNVGHASDTTVARVSAGDISVEGNLLYRAGGTDVPLTDGGTGASTAAAARDNLQVRDAWPSVRWRFFDDFERLDSHWQQSNTGTGASFYGSANWCTIAADEDVLGAVRMDVGASGGSCALYHHYEDIFRPASGWEWWCRFQLVINTATAGQVIRLGVGDGNGSSTPANGIYFAFKKATSNNWLRCTSKASTATETDSSFAVAGSTTYTFRMVYNGSNIDFYYSTTDGEPKTWTSLGSNSTNVPTNTSYMRPFFYVSSTTAYTSIDIDYIDMWRTSTR